MTFIRNRSKVYRTFSLFIMIAPKFLKIIFILKSILVSFVKKLVIIIVKAYLKSQIRILYFFTSKSVRYILYIFCCSYIFFGVKDNVELAFSHYGSFFLASYIAFISVQIYLCTKINFIKPFFF
jgi:hypothetical protein